MACDNCPWPDTYRCPSNTFGGEAMTRSIQDSEQEIDEIILKLYRPHPNIQPEDRAFLNDPKCIEAKSEILTLLQEARINELERIMLMPGNAYVGNGENEIHWQTRNRIAQLRNKEEEK